MAKIRPTTKILLKNVNDGRFLYYGGRIGPVRWTARVDQAIGVTSLREARGVFAWSPELKDVVEFGRFWLTDESIEPVWFKEGE